MNLRLLTKVEIQILVSQGCTSDNWNFISIADNLDISKIESVRFIGPVTISEGVILRNIPGGIGGCIIEENVLIENVDSIAFEKEANHGVGTLVAVLDETGSRSVPIYPGLSSQIATLMCRETSWIKKFDVELKQFIDTKKTTSIVGEKAVIRNCGEIKNVSIGKEIKIEGASRLINGSVVNNAAPGKCLTYIGNDVEAENFIIEDGRVESKSNIVNCYVGQGTVLSHGFSAHDSLFFANCALEHGEAHSLLAGPYTVSMHKGSLLIGCQTSFFNAGSSSNQSNHMYKLGPVHWGILERGVKTSSGSYLMLGAKIGAFSLLMGAHKTHPDSSDFPFSYLFGDDRGATIVVPGIMLRSCGLMRDEIKWPARDKRLKGNIPLFDHITFNVLNPFTVNTMLKALSICDILLTKPADDDLYMRYKMMKFTRAGIERARSLYNIAICKYLSLTLNDFSFPKNDGVPPEDWIDLGGQIMPRSFLNKALQCDDIQTAELIFSEAFENYHDLELQWIGRRFGTEWREDPEILKRNAAKFDKMVEEDRQEYLQNLNRETEMLSL